MMRGIFEVNWQGVWERVGPALMHWDPKMRPVSFGVAKLEEIRLCEDGSHICVPIFIDYSSSIFQKQSLTNVQIPIPEGVKHNINI